MSKYAILTARRLEERRVWAWLIAIVLVLSGATVFLTMEGLGSTQNSTLSGSVPLSNTIHAVWGINGTGSGSVYREATLTISGTQVTATFPAGFEPTHIVVFQKNTLYDIEGILNTSYYYQQLNLKTSDTGANVHANLTGLYSVVGTEVNDSSLNNVNDKGFTDIALNQTWYSNSVNNLNKSMALNLLGLAHAKWTSQYVGYIASVNYSHGNSTGVFSFVITQQFQRPYSFDLIRLTSEVMAVVAFVTVIMLINAMPRKGGY